MTKLHLDELEKKAKEAATVPSAIALQLIDAVRQAQYETENYKRLVAYYQGEPDGAEAVRVRAESA